MEVGTSTCSGGISEQADLSTAVLNPSLQQALPSAVLDGQAAATLLC